MLKVCMQRIRTTLALAPAGLYALWLTSLLEEKSFPECFLQGLIKYNLNDAYHLLLAWMSFREVVNFWHFIHMDPK